MAVRSSYYRMDEQVFFTMGGLVLLSLLIWGFRVGTHKSCGQVAFSAGNGPFFTKQPIQFKATTGGKVYEWDFGDGTAIEQGNDLRSHTYTRPLKYTVSLTVDGECQEFIDVHVEEQHVMEVVKESSGTFDGPVSAYVDETVTFTDNDQSHTKWNWFIEGQAGVQGLEKEFRYPFPKEGPFRIVLKVNGKEDKPLVKDIYVVRNEEKIANQVLDNIKKKAKEPKIAPVKDKPDEPPLNNDDKNKPAEEKKVDVQKPPEPVKQMKPLTKTSDWKIMIEQYHDEKIRSDEFEKYTCGPVAVTYNGNPITFDQLLTEVKKIKKIKSVNVEQLTIEKSTNCVTGIVLSIKKKGLFF